MIAKPITIAIAAFMIFGLAALSCGEPGVNLDEEAVAEARALYPRFIDVQQYIVGRSCAPNAGVCHNTNNYPDLHTPGNTLSMVRAFCNVELPDPTLGWNECERPGDLVEVGDFVSEIAWIEQLTDLSWRIGLREPTPEALNERPEIRSADEAVVLDPLPEWNVVLTAEAGAREAEIRVSSQQPFIDEFVGTVMNSVVGGDPNQDERYGGSDDEVISGALVVPGDLDRSYFWGRITGTVPGSRMPLANEALSFSEYVAIACWIESLPGDGELIVDGEIDYDACNFAQAPINFAEDADG